MKLLDLLHISLQNFKNRKSRIFFTILGVSVAIGAVLFLVSFGYGLQYSMLEKITNAESLLTLDLIPSDAEVIKLNNETIDKIKTVESVEKVSTHAMFPGHISLGSLTTEATINLVDDSYLRLEGLGAKSGNFFKNDDNRKVVINTNIAKLFNISEEEIIGKKISLVLFVPNEEEENELIIFETEGEFEIIGIAEDSGSQGQIFANDKDFGSLTIKEYQSVKVKVTKQENLSEVRSNLISMGFFISALSDTIDQANKIFRAIQIVLGTFGVIALVVAAIGLINTMTISLLERTNEIGVMRAIGASPSDILWLFLGESLMIGFLGGISGIILGILSGQLFQAALNFLATSLGSSGVRLFVYPSWFLIFIVTLSSLVGLVGGFFPARRASKLNPLEALRYK